MYPYHWIQSAIKSSTYSYYLKVYNGVLHSHVVITSITKNWMVDQIRKECLELGEMFTLISAVIGSEASVD